MGKRKKQRQATFEIDRNGDSPTLQLQADTWRHLLEISAEGMAELLLVNKEQHSTSETQMFPVELMAVDFDAMLVDWLEEILLLGEKHNMVFHGIEILQLSFEAQCTLTAMVEGATASPSDRLHLRQVARPTPRVRETKEGLRCKVSFTPPGP
jgi:SHS2 domain-containing protein